MAISQSDIAKTLAELSVLSTDELKELCNSPSEERYNELVNKNDKVKSLEAEREMLLASVRSLAEFNLAGRSDYESDRSKLLDLVGEGNKLKENIQTKAVKLTELSKRTTVESTLDVLTAAAAQAEEDSEGVAKAFLDNSLDYESFISQYVEKRKLAHLRRIRADRLRQETNESWTGIHPPVSGRIPLI